MLQWISIRWGRKSTKALRLLAVSAFPILMLGWLPVNRALEIGGDEGYELTKSALVCDGFRLYQPIWNDQPPLHTLVVGALFRALGKTALVARLVTVVAATLLLLALYNVVRWRADGASGVIAVGLLVSSPFFLELSASAMLEVPAFALGLSSLWAWTLFETRRSMAWLLVSGLLFALALLTKLTAIVLAPVVVYWSLACGWQGPDESQSGGRTGIKVLTVWGLVVAGLLVSGFAAVCPEGTARVWAVSHFSPKTFAAAGIRGLHLRDVLGDWRNLMFASGFGGLMIWKKWRVFGAPAALLAVVAGLHAFHRPFWHYYLVHLSIPAAWLGGIGTVESLKWIGGFGACGSRWGRLAKVAGIACWSALCSATFVDVPFKLYQEVESVRKSPPAERDPFVMTMRSRTIGNRWVFTNHRNGCFWTGVRIPPELAVMPLKRIWSDQITPAEMLAALEKYRPSQVVIPANWIAAFRLDNYLTANYHSVAWPGTEIWYERNVAP